MNNLNGKNLLALILIVASGILVSVLSTWNSQQAKTLLTWVAEREGKAAFTRMVHENGASPGILFRAPELLDQIVASDSEILTAGLMMGEEIIASFSKRPELLLMPVMKNPPMGATILDENLTLYRKQSGPGAGSGGRWQGAGQGPPWRRNLSGQNAETDDRISFFLIFSGPDRNLIAPLIYQKILWPVVWMILSVLWVTILVNQTRMARLQQNLQKESHLAAIGKMSARLAHEIKNPLGAIRGMAQFLEKKLADLPVLKTMTSSIEKETFRLEELTRSILDFSKPAELSLVELSLNAIVSDAICLFQLQNANSNISLNMPEAPVKVSGDENAIRQILINLLKNAIDATENNAEILVEIEINNYAALIRVTNPGQLSTETVDHLFEPFYSTKTRGYGLGLPISMKLAQQMDCSLTLSNLDSGRVSAELIFNGKMQQ